MKKQSFMKAKPFKVPSTKKIVKTAVVLGGTLIAVDLLSKLSKS